MARRAYWQGQLRLALVSIPVEIYPATKSGASIAFRQIHEPSGKPIKYEKTVAGLGAIDTDDIVKGYEIAKNDFVLLADEEIEAVKIESRKTLELVQFVESDAIDVLYFEKPYFVMPADDLAEEAYVVLREAMKASRKVGIGQLSVRGREQLVCLKPCGRGIVMEVLRYADEVARAQDAFRDVGDTEPSQDLLDLAVNLIDGKSGPFEPREFHDRYIDALKALVAKKSKAKGRTILEDTEEAPPPGSNVIDLMAALKKSIGSAASASAATAKTAPKNRTATKSAPAKPAAKKPAAKRAATK